ncbi:TPA: hypothetical protein DIC20_05495 [Candidatus Dependentiae bacterium]|nr:MAG: Platelet-activating factor acetylhydrolase, plasma/intracellular isoform II [candidate division TM6 bacterium GW2011_GWF2_36_131]KKQ03146.1 MAG: Platelet-activating factor acetylhydrolase, plasma/intracellular isoform II [candidate division TM6 bacterium GW2011_GWE2_36_25]KKQ19366.1 MAG: Platelet-activating factor acetylhydrolase, plasma/intracellular isoform II [candidate division TM6 bacterium GW2011_GWA2_36_9]HBR71046.1 hypothetical protein [Candidatus Dependentiae bacterium]HCU01120
MFWLLSLILWLLVGIMGIALLAFIILAYFIWLQPIFSFPKPTGPFAVGMREYHWIDRERSEVIKVCAHPNRELIVRLWYPAQGEVPLKPSWPWSVHFVTYLKKKHRFVWLQLFSRPLRSYTQFNISLSSEEKHFPVIIFSHGFGCTHDFNTAHCEELASHGYVVVAINHTYCSTFSQFPDGRIVGLGPIQKMAEEAGDFKKFLDQQVEVWIADVQFVLDQIERISTDRDSIFYQWLDLSNVGMFGHSMGGATAVHICCREPRIKAVVNLDGSLSSERLKISQNKPYMFIFGGNACDLYERLWTEAERKQLGLKSVEEEQKEKAFYFAVKRTLLVDFAHAYKFVIKGAGHADFCDRGLFKSATLFSLFFMKDKLGTQLGSIDGFRATEIVNAYLVNFFDKYLKGKPSALLDGNEKVYAEIEKR